MTEKRYFKKEYDEEYYIFDSTKISEEKVDVESEYGYDVFANSMQGNEVVDLLNEQDNLINELEKEKISLQIKLQKIRDFAEEDGEVKQGVIEKVVMWND